MNISRVPSFLIAGLIVIGAANAQTAPDPYNPQTRRSTAPQPAEPTLADMGFGTDQGNIGPFVSNTDKQYAQAMAERGMMEVRLGEVAIEKSGREDVKKIAHRMVTDYLNWNDGMAKAAKKLSIELPTELDAKDKAEVDRICALSGPAFDEAYLKAVVRLQSKALSMSHHEASDAAVSGFRHWAGVVIPNLQEQVHTAQVALKANQTVASK
jgi:putative membrane protein